jgi:hypothetical protein
VRVDLLRVHAGEDLRQGGTAAVALVAGEILLY